MSLPIRHQAYQTYLHFHVFTNKGINLTKLISTSMSLPIKASTLPKTLSPLLSLYQLHFNLVDNVSRINSVYATVAQRGNTLA